MGAYLENLLNHFSGRRIVFILLILFAISSSFGQGQIHQQMNKTDRLSNPLNLHVWLDLRDVSNTDCEQVIVGFDLIKELSKVKEGFDRYSALRKDLFKVLRKFKIKNPEEYLSRNCFDSPLDIKTLGYDNVEALINSRFVEINEGEWSINFEVDGDPLELNPGLYAAFIQAGYHVSFTDLVPVLRLTKGQE